MRKYIAGLVIGLCMVVAAPAYATPAQPVHAEVKKKKKYPVKKRYVNKYNLKKWELKEIKSAKKWAKGSTPKRVRQCESGGNYKINTGNGYYGAYQFAYGTWLGSGGGRYERLAHTAPRFAQDHIAYKLWKQRGWQPWGCA